MSKMHPKTQAFADELLNNKKLSPTQAYLNTHITTNRRTANDLASKTLKRPSVQIYMQKHINAARNTIVSLSQDAEREEIRLKASQDILDRTLGKAIQRQVNENTNLNLNVEASQEIKDQFTEFIKNKTKIA